jgi:hypothetical protein
MGRRARATRVELTHLEPGLLLQITDHAKQVARRGLPRGAELRVWIFGHMRILEQELPG